MTLHPQFFDRDETLILEPLVGQTGMRGQPAGHGPGAITVQACTDLGTAIRAEFEQVVNLGAASAPLFPVALPRTRRRIQPSISGISR
jgi:hypothetical protein